MGFRDTQGRRAMTAQSATALSVHHKPFFKSLYFQVLTAIVLGILLGHYYPQLGEQMKPLGDGFIKLIKMIIAPIIFCTVVHGIASMQDMKKVGRVGLKALVYFEALTTLAPIGAFGAMALPIGKYGVATLLSLAQLMVAFYVTCLIFVMFVLGGVAWLAGFNILKFIRYIKEELLIVLGTSSSESVLPRMIAKMENLGCEKSVVGLVIPTGYSFNLDGTCIYLTMAALFLAQATGTDLSLTQQIGIVGILLLTSKGAAGVTGSGFIVLAATLASVGTIPVAAIALILGVDRFMSEARALTNLIGNGVATVVVSKWEGALDVDRMRAHLNNATEAEASKPEEVMVEDEIKAAGAPRPATF